MTDTDENAGYRRSQSGGLVALEQTVSVEDRLSSPSAARNRHVIANAYREHMPRAGRILEIGCGSGEHALCITALLPDLVWVPSDPDPKARASVAAWTLYEKRTNIETPLDLDSMHTGWWQKIPSSVSGNFQGMVSINMIHIAPFEASKGLFAAAKDMLAPGGKVFLYGPFKRQGETAASNLRFDEDLKRRESRWGVRDLDLEIIPLAEQAGLQCAEIIEAPANNLVVIFHYNGEP